MSFSGSEGVKENSDLTLTNGLNKSGFEFFNRKLIQEIVEMLKIEFTPDQMQALSFAPAAVIFEIAQKGIEGRQEFANFLERNADEIKGLQDQHGKDSPYYLGAEYGFKPH